MLCVSLQLRLKYSMAITNICRVTVEIPENVWRYAGHTNEFRNFNDRSGWILGDTGVSGMDTNSVPTIWGETIEWKLAVAFEKAWKVKISEWIVRLAIGCRIE